MSDCHHKDAALEDQPVSAAGALAGSEAASADSCCAEPARTDYFFWGCVVLVAVAYTYGAIQSGHQHDSVLAVFTGGIFELFNLMWWGMALGVFFVGVLARVPGRRRAPERNLLAGQHHGCTGCHQL